MLNGLRAAIAAFALGSEYLPTWWITEGRASSFDGLPTNEQQPASDDKGPSHTARLQDGMSSLSSVLIPRPMCAGLMTTFDRED
jgi:hypothetical protein